MMGRFFDEIEKRYMKHFKKQKILSFRHINRIEAYYSLLEKAIERGTPVTDEEIKEYLGEELYEKEMNYVSQWE